jgi:Tfp pilus assembly protein FimT
MTIFVTTRRRQRGFSMTELLVVGLLTALILTVTLPDLKRFYLQHQVDSASAMVRTTAQRARMSALKERNAYRVLLHDENSATPNTIEVQQDQGGTFVTVSGEVHALNEAIRILGANPTDSMNSITVNRRGECTSGRVYVATDGADMRTVTIASTCFTSTSH